MYVIWIVFPCESGYIIIWSAQHVMNIYVEINFGLVKRVQKIIVPRPMYNLEVYDVALERHYL